LVWVCAGAALFAKLTGNVEKEVVVGLTFVAHSFRTCGTQWELSGTGDAGVVFCGEKGGLFIYQI
jgi:hypothetical protein